MSHPIGAEIETISHALAAGMVDDVVKVPEHLKLNYEDPLADGAEGVATLRFADWNTENQGVLYVPMVVDPDNMAWKVRCEDGLIDVEARIMVRDILGRTFTFSANNEQKVTGYLQFDVLDNGILFSAQPLGEEVVSTYGGFEGQTYDLLATYAKRVSSLNTILDLALRY